MVRGPKNAPIDVLFCAFTAMAGRGQCGGAGCQAAQLITNQAYVERSPAQKQPRGRRPDGGLCLCARQPARAGQGLSDRKPLLLRIRLNGVSYAGNIKLDAQLRSEGQVCRLPITRIGRPGSKTSRAPISSLGAEQGVTIEKVDPLAYRLSYENKSVVFELNDLSQVKPPAAALGPASSSSARFSTTPRCAFSWCLIRS